MRRASWLERGLAALEQAELAPGRVRRELFERVGGFDDSLPSGGDFDFAERCLAAGAHAVFVHDAIVRHPTIDEARPFLRKLWFRDRAAAEWDARAGRPPARARPLQWIPGMNLLRRRAVGLSLGLDRLRLAEAGLRLGRATELRACLVRELLVNYWVALAQVSGWRAARRRRHAAAL